MGQAEYAGEGQPLDLREYLALLRQRKWTVILVTLLVLGASLALSFSRTPVYTSSSRLLVKPSNLQQGSTNVPVQLAVNLETERELATSESVARLVRRDLESNETTDGLLAGLTVEVAAETEVLIVNYVHPDPEEAALRADAFAQAYLDFRRDNLVEDLLASTTALQERIQTLSGQLDDINDQIADAGSETERSALQTQATSLVSQIAVLQQEVGSLNTPDSLRVGQVVETADVPETPSSPNHIRNGMLGLILGLLAGVALAFVRERLDDRLRGRPELEAVSRAPVLAVIPKVEGWRKKDETYLATLNDPKSGASEAYRTLRTAVLFSMAQRGAKTLLISSPHAGEGKTSTSANLGVVLAQAGKRVVIISGDLRKPRLGKFFGVQASPGLTNVLAGEVPLWQCLVQPNVENLRVLPSGPIPGNPAELLGSSAMGTVLSQLREAADVVLIDGPPVLVVADTMAAAPLVDAVILLADAQKTTRGAVEHARMQLDQVGANVVGAVLNNVDYSKGGAAAPYYYRYSYKYEEVEPKKKAAQGR